MSLPARGKPETPDKPDSPLNKQLPPLRTVPIEVPYWSDGTLAFH